MPILWAIAHIFRFLGWFLVIVTTDTWFERLCKNSCFSCLRPPFPLSITHSFHVSANFMGFSAHFSISRAISSYRKHRFLVWEVSQKLMFFIFAASILVGYTSQFSCFLPILCAIAHIFQFLGRFPATVITDTWFERRRKNSFFNGFAIYFHGL